MAAIRLPSIRHLTSKHPRRLPLPQRRWARVHDVRFVATQQTQDHVTDRYRDKLHQKVKERGLNDIGQLKEVYREEIQDLKKKATVPGATAPLDKENIPPSDTTASSTSSRWPKPPPPPQPQSSSPAAGKARNIAKPPPGVKTLSSFLDIDKVADLPQREIETLWRLRHAQSTHSLCAAMPTTIYETIARTARRHPHFILPGLPPVDDADATNGVAPTPKNGPRPTPNAGAPIHFMQWTFPSATTATVLFTHLAEYKLRGEHSQPHTTHTYHTELSASRALVLCQGNVVPDRGVSVEEGKWLVLQLQKFYNIGEEAERGEESKVAAELKRRRRRLVEMFSSGDQGFRVEELLEEAERLG